MVSQEHSLIDFDCGDVGGGVDDVSLAEEAFAAVDDKNSVRTFADGEDVSPFVSDVADPGILFYCDSPGMNVTGVGIDISDGNAFIVGTKAGTGSQNNGGLDAGRPGFDFGMKCRGGEIPDPVGGRSTAGDHACIGKFFQVGHVLCSFFIIN